MFRSIVTRNIKHSNFGWICTADVFSQSTWMGLNLKWFPRFMTCTPKDYTSRILEHSIHLYNSGSVLHQGVVQNCHHVHEYTLGAGRRRTLLKMSFMVHWDFEKRSQNENVLIPLLVGKITKRAVYALDNADKSRQPSRESDPTSTLHS